MAKNTSTGTVSVEVGPAKIKGDDTPITYLVILGVLALSVFWIYAKYIHRHAVNHVKRVVQRNKARKASRKKTKARKRKKR